jgi:hypothetical protein
MTPAALAGSSGQIALLGFGGRGSTKHRVHKSLNTQLGKHTMCAFAAAVTAADPEHMYSAALPLVSSIIPVGPLTTACWWDSRQPDASPSLAQILTKHQRQLVRTTKTYTEVK